jgi:hypothetical protein
VKQPPAPPVWSCNKPIFPWEITSPIDMNDKRPPHWPSSLPNPNVITGGHFGDTLSVQDVFCSDGKPRPL